MILDARQFEGLLKRREGIADKGLPDVEYYRGENMVILRLIDVRTFGGVIRFYRGPNDALFTTGSTTIPLRLRRPFRLAATGVYVWYFHLSLVGLPKEVTAFIEPTPQMSEAGVYFTGSHFIGDEPHELTSVAMMGRMVEVEEDYPVALLGFMPQQVLETETATVEEEERPKSGATTSSRSKPKRSS
jgi:hypothetical protein